MMETPGELIRGGDSSVILKVENLHFRWGANEVLKNINFDVSGNEMVAIPVSYTHLTLPTKLTV